MKSIQGTILVFSFDEGLSIAIQMFSFSDVICVRSRVFFALYYIMKVIHLTIASIEKS